MATAFFGVIHGKTIELADAPPLADGVEVEVQVRPARPKAKPGDGFRRTEGALADDQEWDAIMEELQQGRRQERRSQWEDEQ